MARRIKLSKHGQKLLDAFASDVSDNREWNNEHNLKRSRAALVHYIDMLERASVLYLASVYPRKRRR